MNGFDVVERSLSSSVIANDVFLIGMWTEKKGSGDVFSEAAI